MSSRKSHGDHRDLHSFPTRRSSDLAGGERVALLGAADEIRVHVILRRELRGVRDRKSTRLNSSHVAISYAVFCLKKKIMHNEVCRTYSDKTGTTLAFLMLIMSFLLD